MSIKSFHIIFILFSVGITIWLGFWGLNQSIYISIASFLFGVAYVTYKLANVNHVFNIFLDSQNKFYCLEPQEDLILPCLNYTSYQIYQITF